jgi:hypothetical protein
VTEADITQLMAMNRQAFIGWLTASLIWTLAIFFLAYVIRNTPVFVRGTVFAVFLLGALSFFMTLNITNLGFLRLVQDLAAASPQTGFSQGVIEALGDKAPAFPVWARLGTPLVFLLNALIGFHLLIREKWER